MDLLTYFVDLLANFDEHLTYWCASYGTWTIAILALIVFAETGFPRNSRATALSPCAASWNRSKPSGYRVLRVRFGADGKPTGMEDFVTGWLLDTPPPTQFGRVAGLAVAQDGSLLIAKDQNGMIYRVRYSGR